VTMTHSLPFSVSFAVSPSCFETFSSETFDYLHFPIIISALNDFIVSKARHDDKGDRN
jgi:Ca2+-binding EF-hand superfamily protein